MDDLVNRKPIAPWEEKGQVDPQELPDFAPDKYLAPWTLQERGNGHIDLYDSNGAY